VYDPVYGILPSDKPANYFVSTGSEVEGYGCIDPGTANNGSYETLVDPGHAENGMPDEFIEYYNPEIPDDVIVGTGGQEILPRVTNLDAGVAQSVYQQFNSYIDSGGISNWSNACQLGKFGVQPWGDISYFPTYDAYWIWNEEGASEKAKANIPVVFKYWFDNTSGVPIMANINYMADNTCNLYMNETLIDTDSGYPVGSWTTTTGFRQKYVEIPEGITEFTFVCVNWGGEAGLIFSIVDIKTNEVYAKSNSSILTVKDWYADYITNYVDKNCTLSNTVSMTIKPIIGELTYIPISICGSTQFTFDDLKGFEVASDGKGIVGTVTSLTPFTITVELGNITIIIALIPQEPELII